MAGSRACGHQHHGPDFVQPKLDCPSSSPVRAQGRSAAVVGSALGFQRGSVALAATTIALAAAAALDAAAAVA